MHLKNGNRLVCKKNCSNVFIKDKSYKISLISKNDMGNYKKGNSYRVEYRDGYCLVYTDTNFSNIFETKIYVYPRYAYLYDYFYNLKQSRKLKLEAINEGR